MPAMSAPKQVDLKVKPITPRPTLQADGHASAANFEKNVKGNIHVLSPCRPRAFFY